MNIARIPKANRFAPYISARKLGTEVKGRNENDHQVTQQNADPEIL